MALDQIIYDAQGHTGNVYYVRFVLATPNHAKEGWIWDWNADALAQAPTWINSATLLVENGTTGQFPVNIPTNLPKGALYDIIVYQRSGAVPANTDDITKQWQRQIGSIFGF